MGIDATVEVHPSAIIEEGAVVGPGCRIGPFSSVGSKVTLGEGVVLKSHAVVTGLTEVGDETVVFPGAVVGEIPQDLKFRGEETRLIVGKRNRIREGATLNTGTEGGGGVTRMGADCLLMTGAHVGHDAQGGERVVIANQTALAGHCIVGDDVIIGGLSGIHQHVRLGRGAIIGALTMVTHDVIPYGLVHASRGELEGLNLVGLRRRGADRAESEALRAAYKHLAEADGAFMDRARALSDRAETPQVREIVEFILGHTDRSFLTPR